MNVSVHMVNAGVLISRVKGLCVCQVLGTPRPLLELWAPRDTPEQGRS